MKNKAKAVKQRTPTVFALMRLKGGSHRKSNKAQRRAEQVRFLKEEK